MRVSLLQRTIEWCAAENNRNRAEEWIARCSQSQLVVLPEMFTTGFCTDPSLSAESGEPTLAWMCLMAKKYNLTLVGSVAIEQDGRYFNRLYVVRPDGSSTKYDKRHLFSFAGEDKNYTAGSERVVVEIEGVRTLLLVCYDLRFPVWIRSRGDYDLILCVANWPTPRRRVWDLLLRARAVENLCYVGGVNIVDSDPNVSYSGGTAAVNFLGDVVASVNDDEQGVATFDVDLDALSAFRAKFPALDDADNFEIR